MMSLDDYWADEIMEQREAQLAKKESSSDDAVNSPKHYTLAENFEVKDLMKLILTRVEESDGMSMTHFQASCYKECLQYLLRAPLKNGWEDVRKAKYYLDLVLEEEDEKND